MKYYLIICLGVAIWLWWEYRRAESGEDID